MAEKITPREIDYSQWYIDIVLNAKLADYSPVKGSMVIRPRGYAIWEKIRDEFDRRFKETGHENAYFPLLIPMSFLKKEAEHVEGFAPELAVVTHGGGEELEEPYCIRPTSETIIWAMYRNWIQSWRDLPLLINQWANVIRWEKRTRLFLRTSEFLWQEGHTAHETEKEAREETLRILEIYRDVVERCLAVPVVAGMKSESEKFAGAVETYTIEAMMQDKKALQAGTSHFLGQNFARAFDVQFQNRQGQLDYVWATSWGVSTRLIGAVIMTHSDDKGLVLPPALSPEDAVIIPIYRNDSKAAVIAYAKKLEADLKTAGFKVVLDIDDSSSPGWKFTEWELRGTPVRIEIGPRDIKSNQIVMVRRDTGEKLTALSTEAASKLKELHNLIQSSLFERARSFREKNTEPISDLGGLIEFFGTETAGTEGAPGGFAEALWCGSAACEASIKEKTKATIRCLPLGKQDHIEGTCAICGDPAKYQAIFARNY
ncbi:MAG TPA: proline--tRNA ligase [Rectinema sp.]|nr:proline--tRNA ligase [Rectinema sp.]HQL16833.1 proline--tRNA ligase [Rectinema sp.]